jgi:hypothetical protein
VISSTVGLILIIFLVVVGLAGMIAVPLHLERKQALQAVAVVIPPSGPTVTFGKSPPRSGMRDGDIWNDRDVTRVWDESYGLWVCNKGPGAAAVRARISAARDQADGLLTHEQVARWLSPDVRAAIEAGLPDELRSADSIPHGTVAGFQQHRAHGERLSDTCRPCRDAYRTHLEGLKHRQVAHNQMRH